MRKASLASGLGLACLLSTATIARAADPGSEDPNNWPQYQPDRQRVALQSARPDQPGECR